MSNSPTRRNRSSRKNSKGSKSNSSKDSKGSKSNSSKGSKNSSSKGRKKSKKKKSVKKTLYQQTYELLQKIDPPLPDEMIRKICDSIYTYRFKNKEELKKAVKGYPNIDKYGDCKYWDVSNVTDMSGLFEGTEFNGDISDWDVSKVTDMSILFADSQFNGDISKWEVGKVLTNMYYSTCTLPLPLVQDRVFFVLQYFYTCTCVSLLLSVAALILFFEQRSLLLFFHFYLWTFL